MKLFGRRRCESYKFTRGKGRTGTEPLSPEDIRELQRQMYLNASRQTITKMA